MDDRVQTPDPGPLHQDPGLGPGLRGPAADERAPAVNVDDAAIVSPTDRATAFVPVPDGGEASPSAELLLVIAYVAMWLLLLGFVWGSFRRLGRLDARLREVEEALARHDATRAEREP